MHAFAAKIHRVALSLSRNREYQRAFISRAKWLIRGTTKMQAWSLEYRSNLSGRFAVPLSRTGEQEPHVESCPSDCRANSPLYHVFERRFTYLLTDTVADTSTGATVSCGTSEPPFFIRESISWPFESVLAHGLTVPEPNRAKKTIRGPAAVFPTSMNYYHWLIEDLPLVMRAIESEPTVQLLSSSSGITQRHAIVADYLDATLVPCPELVRIQRQVLPGRAADSFFPHPADCHAVFELGRGLTKGKESHASAVYVSRSRSSRSLKGELQIEGILAQSGFTVVHLEDLAWVDQIRLFQGADLVVGPHGAGLANAVFCTPGTAIIELTVGHHFNRCFEWLAHACDLQYWPIEADSDPSLTVENLATRILDAIRSLRTRM